MVSEHQKEEFERPQVTVIYPTKGWAPLDLQELWRYRELAFFLAWRDVKVRYKQTVLGIGWAVIQPVLLMVVFTILFSQLARISSNGVPYPIFLYAAILPWTLFARGLTDASTSLVSNQALVTKVYFPRLLLPAASILAALLDFGIGLIVLGGLMVWFRVVPTVAIFTLPLFVLLTVMCAMGIGFWASALDARFRDVRYTLPFLTQVWLFATPVVYPLSLVPESWRWMYGLNPMVAVVQGFRWSLLGDTAGFDPILGISVVTLVLVFVSGLYYFRRVERSLADVV